MIVFLVNGLKEREDDRPFWGPVDTIPELIAETENPSAHLWPCPTTVHSLVIADGLDLAHRNHPVVPESGGENSGLRLPAFPVGAMKVRDAGWRWSRGGGEM